MVTWSPWSCYRSATRKSDEMIRLNLNVFVFAGAHQGLGQVSDNLFICFIHLTPVPLTALMTVICVI
jgi:hypothetical protein